VSKVSSKMNGRTRSESEKGEKHPLNCQHVVHRRDSVGGV